MFDTLVRGRGRENLSPYVALDMIRYHGHGEGKQIDPLISNLRDIREQITNRSIAEQIGRASCRERV